MTVKGRCGGRSARTVRTRVASAAVALAMAMAVAPVPAQAQAAPGASAGPPAAAPAGAGKSAVRGPTVVTPAIQLTPRQVAAHVWTIEGEAGMATAANRAFNSNAGFVVTPGGVVVFDALGTPALGSALRAAVARVTPLPIRLVIVSHFHADHFYGVQALAGPDVQVWASARGRDSFASAQTAERLEQRRRDLAPWVDAQTRPRGADRWIAFRDGEHAFTFGGQRFVLIDVGGAHSPEDLMLWYPAEGVLFAGDLYFSGRLPFVGNADTAAWLQALDRIAPLQPKVVVPGHGAASSNPAPDIALTRAYLQYLRATMGAAVRELKPFDEAYRDTDWSRYADAPAFEAANRINAYGVYLRMEQEALRR